MCRNMFLIFTGLGCAVIIPINVVYNLKNAAAAQSMASTNAFFLTTPTLLYGSPLYAHVAVTWVFDIVICGLLWTNYSKIISLRRTKFMTEEYQNALFMRSLMVTEIPKQHKRSDSALASLVTTQLVKLDASQTPIQNATVGRDVSKLSKLIHKHELTVYKLEAVLAKYLKNPDNLPAQRPLCRPFKDLDGGGGDFISNNKKVDAIDYLCCRMQSLNSTIEETRASIDTNKTLPYGFVSYETVEACHSVAQSTRQRRRGKLNATLAPRGSDIIWTNLVLTRFERGSKQKWGNFLFLCLLVGWIIPNAFMGTFLSQLSRIGALWPAFSTFMGNYPVLFSVLQGVLSPIVTALVFLILPVLMRKIAQSQGRVTKHEREIDVTKKLYAFFVFNNLFVFTIFSVAWGLVATVIALVKSSENNVTLTFDTVVARLDLAEQLSQAILGASSFWVMYILRVNLSAVLDLLQLVSLFWRGFRRHLGSPTPRELLNWTAPQHFDFASYYNWMLFYTTIALCFAMVQPLVLPVIALYFLLDSVYKKYSLMYIFVTKAESDGQYWPFLFNALLFATGFGNVVLFAVVWVQGGWKVAVCLGPLLPLLIAFKIFSRKAHNDRFHYFIPTPNEREEMELSRTRSTLSDMSHHALARRYRNPAITTKLIVPLVHAKAQHVLPEICGVSEYARAHELNLEKAFGKGSSYGGGGDDQFSTDFDTRTASDDGRTPFNTLSGTPAAAVDNGGGFKFDIVHDEDITYEHYKELERARVATPFNATPEHTYGTIASDPIPPMPTISGLNGIANLYYPPSSKASQVSSIPVLQRELHQRPSTARLLTGNTVQYGHGGDGNSVHQMTSRDSLIHHQQAPARGGGGGGDGWDGAELESVRSIGSSYYGERAAVGESVIDNIHYNYPRQEQEWEQHQPRGGTPFTPYYHNHEQYH